MNRTIAFYKTTTCVIMASILLLVWIYPTTAFAWDVGETTGSVGGDLIMLVLKLVLSVVSVLGSILIMKAISYFEKKTKIDIPAATEKMLFDWADQGIGLAHEKAHQILQKEGTVLGGNEKLNVALQFVLDIATKHNLEGLAEEKLKDYINSKLGSKRIDETGITTSPNPETVVIAK